MLSAQNNEKFNKILKEIDTAQEEYDARKRKLNNYKDHLQAIKILLNYPEFAKRELFLVKVKWFQSFYDLLNLYPERINTLEQSEIGVNNDINYFYVEVFISHLFHENLKGSEWILDASVTIRQQQESILKLSKSTHLKNNNSNPITLLIPCDSYELYSGSPCKDPLFCAYLSHINANLPKMELAKFSLDVSYKLTHKEAIRLQQNALFKDLKNITSSYSKQNEDLGVSNEVHISKIHFPIKEKEMLKILLQNSCHNLNPALIMKNKEVLSTQLLIDYDSLNLELHMENNYLKLEGNAETIISLKEYFEKFLEGKRILKKHLKIASIDEIKDARITLRNIINTNSNALMNAYCKYLQITEKVVL